MDARIADGALSVVVFCRDVVPDTVAESMSDTCTLRRYLDAGGKIVWYSDWPFYYQGSSDGTMTTWDSAGATSVLGFNASSGPNDSYDEVVFTDAGVAWGLTQTWESRRPTSPTVTDNLTVLATVSSGSAAAWVKHYVPGDKYRGFVRIFDQAGEANPDDIMRLAEYTAVKAENPNPSDGDILLDTWVNLSWSPGAFGASHDVYVSDNFDDVNDGTGDAFRGNQALTYFVVGFLGFPYPDGLVPGTTYYWRIDDVEADGTTKYKGNVWSFTVPPKKASYPAPPDGAKFVGPDVELGWTAGFRAKLHYVYFGDNFDDVNSAVVGLPQATTSYSPGTLELEKTYYWRVDEFDGFATHKGDVWSFETLPDLPITDPSLIGWWKLDEGYGTTAVDWSGHGNHGTFVGDPQWVAGYDEDALEFDGYGDFLDCGADPSLGISGAVSITAWIKVGAQGIAHKVGGNQDGSNGGYKMSMYSNNRIEFEIRTSDNTAILNRDIAGGTEIVADVWYHVAGIYSQADGYIRTYVNGVLDRQLITTEALGASPGTFYIGCEPYSTGSDNFNGVIDNVRLYNKALTPEEIQQAMRGDPLLAGLPKPSNGSTPYIRDATHLSWSPGDNASGHDVYFGIDRDAVADADSSDTTGIYRGRQGVTIYTPPDVEWGGGPYYWRVDEYNNDATISKGNVWSFTVIDFIGIDDIEDYNDYPPDEIFSTWIDGWEVPTNGSIAGHANPPFAETSIVHGGSQSMPVYYENNFKYSEITMTLVSVRDWTEEGVGVLSLWFRGNPAGFVEGPAGTYTMSAAGTDIWNDADEFRYAYKQLSGDGSITATVESVLWVPGSDDWTKAGVMIRDTLDAGSKNAFVALTTGSGDGATFQWRPIAGGSSSSNRTLVSISPPSAIRLVRQGNTFTGYVFLNGQWQQEGQSATVAMADPVYIGLALTSHSSGVTTEAEFSDVLTTGAVTPLTWTHEAIGAAMAANDPAPMYVNLNGIATVYHDNPDAVLIEEWTEWTIDLSAPGGFAAQGVNLANVNTISIGFGDKSSLQAGGSGMVLFDDIRLYRPAP